MNKILERIKKLKEFVSDDEKPVLENDPVQILLDREIRIQYQEEEFETETPDLTPESPLPVIRSEKRPVASQITPSSEDPLMQLIQEIPEEPEDDFKIEKPAMRVLKSFKIQPVESEIPEDTGGSITADPVADQFSDQTLDQEGTIENTLETEPTEPAAIEIKEPEVSPVNIKPNAAKAPPQPVISSAGAPPAPEKVAPPAAVKPPENKGTKTNDLLDIFREEEKVDKGPITEGLEVVDSTSLADEARVILAMIKARCKR